MLKDRVKTVIRSIGGTYVKISEHAGMAAANIGKLTNGSRIPARKSSTAYKLAAGIYGFSDAEGKLETLCGVIGCDPAAGKKRIRKALLDWLYEDVVVLDDHTEGFKQRLNDIMSVVGAGIPEICAETGSGHALLAAYCDGSKIPTRRSKYLMGVCESIYAHAKAGLVIEQVAEMIDIPPSALTDDNAALIIREWLIGRNENADAKAAASLIKQMVDHISPSLVLPDPSEFVPEDAINEDEELYTGISGLQRAVIRFLGNAARTPGNELLLYSDQSMEWMQERFTLKWKALMLACLKSGVRIKMIHNIDREPSEMLFALQSWLPLYMTGQIEPFYRTDISGSRFRHTVFISGTDCIEGFCAAGSERNCVYHYTSGRERVAEVRRSYEKLTTEIKPLLRFQHGDFMPRKQYRVSDCDNIRIYISLNEAVIVKLTEPRCSFTLKHPYLIRAVTMFANEMGVETNCK